MSFVVIPILVGCLSVMTVRDRRETWKAGLPAARPRLVAAGGTYDGTRGRPSDAYVIQERLIAAAHGTPVPGQDSTRSTSSGGGAGETGDADLAHTAAALALAAVVAARPQHAGAREVDLGECTEAAHRAVRAAARCAPAPHPDPDTPAARSGGVEPGAAGTHSVGTPAGSGPSGRGGDRVVSSLDLVVLDQDEHPRLRYAHVGDGAIWHCAKGAEPRPITTAHVCDRGTMTRGLGLPSALAPEIGTLPLRSGDRVALVTGGVTRALGTNRLKALLASGYSPAACLDRLYDEMAALEPEGDATAIIADVVTA
ncbi:hypothetical protein FE391_30080 [Nonomuraea sp. KC401]|uniref:SpoIIE family protein phosphatase n=1 Tax=unclassified Nonomuraea TaxID=2593643 RepID=UPI0010FDBAF4|nr:MULTISPECIES: SpoIIE family protein phosphatase [unclassified Nonomuraea]NBE97377.1 SpoIIE family protein phosphatase [Nonomuraea sp. K271]TLF62407.1 hypothetical protein FE391_30080 [Nonomuraea sp. KC401]